MQGRRCAGKPRERSDASFCLLDGSVDHFAVPCQRPIPEGVKLVSQRGHARWIEPIDPSRSDGTLDDEAGVLEHLQMLGYGGPAYRQPVSQLADGERPLREVLHDRPSSAIAEDGPFVFEMVS